MRRAASKSADPVPRPASVASSPAPVPEGPDQRREGERSEPSRSEAGPSGTPAPSTEVVARATRRRFTAEYKLRVVQEADACRAPGEFGALLRREGLYHGHLSKWRIQRKQGALAALSQRRGPTPPTAEAREVETLRRENARLRRELEKANLCIEVQKKSPSCWGSP